MVEYDRVTFPQPVKLPISLADHNNGLEWRGMATMRAKAARKRKSSTSDWGEWINIGEAATGSMVFDPQKGLDANLDRAMDGIPGPIVISATKTNGHWSVSLEPAILSAQAVDPIK
jgi:hypothetical protein